MRHVLGMTSGILLILLILGNARAETAHDAEIEELKRKIEGVERESQIQIEELKRRIEELEAKKGGNLNEGSMSKVEAGYKKGFFIKTKDDRFNINFIIKNQFRFFVQDFDNKRQKNTEASFQIRRLKFISEGNAFLTWLRYKVQVEGDEGNDLALEDYYIDFSRYKEAQLRVGQFKVPFNRERLTSSFALQFVDRSIVGKEFTLERDIGIMLHGEAFNGVIEYGGGVFNGAGRNEEMNPNNKFLYVGRVMFMPFGHFEYIQGSIENPRKPLLAIASAIALLPDFEPAKEGGTDRKNLSDAIAAIGSKKADVLQFTADIAFKYLGFSLEAEYDLRNISPVGSNISDVTSYGFRVGLGYFLIPKHLETALRYAFLDPNDNESNDRRNAFTYAINYYVYGNRLKIQAGYFLLSEENPNGNDFLDNKFTIQTQFIF